MKKSLGAKTIACPTPLWCIGSYDKNNNPNIMTAAWAGICSSDPPAITVSIRKSRHTYQNILDNKAFTVCIPSEKYTKEADYFGIVSGKNVNKFEVSGLTPIKGDKVNAPYVEEFPMVIECKLLKTVEIGVHIQFIGEILDVKVDEQSLDENGSPDIKKLETILYSSPNKSYFGTGKEVGKAFNIGNEFKK